MRTALFLVAMAIHDVAVTLGAREFESGSMNVLVGLLILFFVMDVIEIIKKP